MRCNQITGRIQIIFIESFCFFGKDIDNLLKSIPGSDNIKNLDIDAKVEGTLSKPVIKPDLSKAIKAVTKAAEKELKGNLLQGIQNLFKKK